MLCLAGAAPVEDAISERWRRWTNWLWPPRSPSGRGQVQHVEQLGDYVATAFSHAVTGRPRPGLPGGAHRPGALLSRSRGHCAPIAGPGLGGTTPADGAGQPGARGRGHAGASSASGGAGRERRVLVRGRPPAAGVRRACRHPGGHTSTGSGTISDDHPLCFGRDWQNVVARADVLLVVGTQLGHFAGYGHYPNLDQLIQVDIDPTNLSKATLASSAMPVPCSISWRRKTDAWTPTTGSAACARGPRPSPPPRLPWVDPRRCRSIRCGYAPRSPASSSRMPR